MPDLKKSPWRISKRNLSNIKVVVLCIVAATTFWVLNALNKDNYSTIVDYPIQWKFDEENYVAVKALPKNIQIQITGNGWDLLRKYFNISSTPYSIQLDSPAEKKFLLPSDLKRSLGEFITPTLLENVLGDTLFFQIDRIVTRTLRPELDTTSYALDKNSVLNGKVTFSPDKVELKGPSSLLDGYEGKFPVKLNSRKINSDYSSKVPLAVEEKFTSLIQLTQQEIEVSFAVITYLEGNKRLKLKKQNFPTSVSLQDEELVPVLSYLIEESNLPELEDLEFEAILDYRKRNRADSTLQLVLLPNPSFLKEVTITPPVVKLKYE